MIKDYLIFLWRAFILSFSGNRRFYGWMTVLTILVIIGGRAYTTQIVHGLASTGMTDQVSWGAYIANFTFLVGVAAAAIMLVIPAYVFRNRAMHDVVLFGELLAIAVILMCLLFVVADLGRPDRFWHLIPIIGVFNFPISLLSWDVLVLNGYLVLNLHICGYLLYMKYRGEEPTRLFYIPFVFIAIAWAISIHTVTAFLYSGLVGRPFWNHAIIAPRFLVSAFVAGPALIVLALQIIRYTSTYNVSEEAVHMLRRIITTATLINLFLVACEVFTEFYSGALHNASAKYLFFGIEHHGEYYNNLVPWIWTAITLECLALVVLMTPLVQKRILFNITCVMLIFGVWVEKGMGMLIPGFIPSPMGDIVEYNPTLNEILVCVGIWSFGALIYSWLLHLSIPILTGAFRMKEA